MDAPYTDFVYKITKAGVGTLGGEAYSFKAPMVSREALQILKYLHRKPYGSKFQTLEGRFGPAADYWVGRLEDEGMVELAGRNIETDKGTVSSTLPTGSPKVVGPAPALRALLHSYEKQPWGLKGPKVVGRGVLKGDVFGAGVMSIQPESTLDIVQTED
jgi:hypothetical protein